MFGERSLCGYIRWWRVEGHYAVAIERVVRGWRRSRTSWDEKGFGFGVAVLLCCEGKWLVQLREMLPAASRFSPAIDDFPCLHK